MNPISFAKLVHEDFITHDRDLASQGFWALAIHRFGNLRMGIRPRLLRLPFSVAYRFLNKCVQIFCGIKLDYTVEVGRRVKIEHFGGMILGAKSIGDGCIIRQNTTMGIKSLSDLQGKPTIGNRVSIGAGAVLVGPIVVGDDVQIGANAVVSRNVPPGWVATGNPAFIRPR